MTFIRCWVLSQSAVTRKELSRQIHANMERVGLRTMNIAQFLHGPMLSLEKTASSNVPNNLFVKNLSLKIYRLFYGYLIQSKI